LKHFDALVKFSEQINFLMKFSFKARIYKTGINWCVDVPKRITSQLKSEKGSIKVKGEINGFKFSKSLVPVKDAPYRLFVNGVMMKGGETALGATANFLIQQDKSKVDKNYKAPATLTEALKKNNLTTAFEELTSSRKKDVLKYLNNIKTEKTLQKNIDKVIHQLMHRKSVRIP
jgi:hypothetical protein